MTVHDLRFSSSCSKDGGTFKLIELPADICKLIENGDSDLVRRDALQFEYIRFSDSECNPSLTIKGSTGEEAVLCTSSKTYVVRSVILSNAVLIVTRPRDDTSSPGDGDAIVIRDECHEILELLPSVPRIPKLINMLRGMEYDDAEEDMGMDVDDDDRPVHPTAICISNACLILLEPAQEDHL